MLDVNRYGPYTHYVITTTDRIHSSGLLAAAQKCIYKVVNTQIFSAFLHSKCNAEV